MTRPGSEPCKRCGVVTPYADMIRVVEVGRKRPVWVHKSCAERWRQVRRIR